MFFHSSTLNDIWKRIERLNRFLPVISLLQCFINLSYKFPTQLLSPVLKSDKLSYNCAFYCVLAENEQELRFYLEEEDPMKAIVAQVTFTILFKFILYFLFSNMLSD